MKRMKLKRASNEERKQRRSLNLFFSLVVFGVIWVSILIAALLVWLVLYLGFYPDHTAAVMENVSNAYSLVFLTGGISLVIGSAVAFLFTKFPMNPISRLASHVNRLADGDYGARLTYRNSVANMAAFKPIVESMNKLAEELQNTEILRSDFINNFSHEFKTPIVSIAGFAKLLRRGNLDEKQREEYLAIIEEESMRLSYMATNVLNMTKIENQSILTDLATFNVSEQIRSSLLLFEEKWSKQQIEIDVDFEEYEITANEEMLKQVWINLFDNALKYTPDGGRIKAQIGSTGENLSVCISNTGSTIEPESLDKIWNKFYQGDRSHSAKGNGIGLAIVKKITELHGGEVSVTSGDGVTAFTVTLPVTRGQ